MTRASSAMHVALALSHILKESPATRLWKMPISSIAEWIIAGAVGLRKTQVTAPVYSLLSLISFFGTSQSRQGSLYPSGSLRCR